jgi:hypothetical protein
MKLSILFFSLSFQCIKNGGIPSHPSDEWQAKVLPGVIEAFAANGAYVVVTAGMLQIIIIIVFLRNISTMDTG